MYEDDEELYFLDDDFEDENEASQAMPSLNKSKSSEPIKAVNAIIRTESSPPLNSIHRQTTNQEPEDSYDIDFEDATASIEIPSIPERIRISSNHSNHDDLYDIAVDNELDEEKITTKPTAELRADMTEKQELLENNFRKSSPNIDIISDNVSEISDYNNKYKRSKSVESEVASVPASADASTTYISPVPSKENISILTRDPKKEQISVAEELETQQSRQSLVENQTIRDNSIAKANTVDSRNDTADHVAEQSMRQQLQLLKKTSFKKQQNQKADTSISESKPSSFSVPVEVTDSTDLLDSDVVVEEEDALIIVPAASKSIDSIQALDKEPETVPSVPFLNTIDSSSNTKELQQTQPATLTLGSNTKSNNNNNVITLPASAPYRRRILSNKIVSSSTSRRHSSPAVDLTKPPKPSPGHNHQNHHRHHIHHHNHSDNDSHISDNDHDHCTENDDDNDSVPEDFSQESPIDSEKKGGNSVFPSVQFDHHNHHGANSKPPVPKQDPAKVKAYRMKRKKVEKQVAKKKKTHAWQKDPKYHYDERTGLFTTYEIEARIETRKEEIIARKQVYHYNPLDNLQEISDDEEEENGDYDENGHNHNAQKKKQEEVKLKKKILRKENPVIMDREAAERDELRRRMEYISMQSYLNQQKGVKNSYQIFAVPRDFKGFSPPRTHKPGPPPRPQPVLPPPNTNTTGNQDDCVSVVTSNTGEAAIMQPKPPDSKSNHQNHHTNNHSNHNITPTKIRPPATDHNHHHVSPGNNNKGHHHLYRAGRRIVDPHNNNNSTNVANNTNNSTNNVASIIDDNTPEPQPSSLKQGGIGDYDKDSPNNPLKLQRKQKEDAKLRVKRMRDYYRTVQRALALRERDVIEQRKLRREQRLIELERAERAKEKEELLREHNVHLVMNDTNNGYDNNNDVTNVNHIVQPSKPQHVSSVNAVISTNQSIAVMDHASVVSNIAVVEDIVSDDLAEPSILSHTVNSVKSNDNLAGAIQIESVDTNDQPVVENTTENDNYDDQDFEVDFEDETKPVQPVGLDDTKSDLQTVVATDKPVSHEENTEILTELTITSTALTVATEEKVDIMMDGETALSTAVPTAFVEATAVTAGTTSTTDKKEEEDEEDDYADEAFDDIADSVQIPVMQPIEAVNRTIGEVIVVSTNESGDDSSEIVAGKTENDRDVNKSNDCSHMPLSSTTNPNQALQEDTKEEQEEVEIAVNTRDTREDAKSKESEEEEEEYGYSQEAFDDEPVDDITTNTTATTLFLAKVTEVSSSQEPTLAIAVTPVVANVEEDVIKIRGFYDEDGKEGSDPQAIAEIKDLHTLRLRESILYHRNHEDDNNSHSTDSTTDDNKRGNYIGNHEDDDRGEREEGEVDIRQWDLDRVFEELRNRNPTDEEGPSVSEADAQLLGRTPPTPQNARIRSEYVNAKMSGDIVVVESSDVNRVEEKLELYPQEESVVTKQTFAKNIQEISSCNDYKSSDSDEENSSYQSSLHSSSNHYKKGDGNPEDEEDHSESEEKGEEDYEEEDFEPETAQIEEENTASTKSAKASAPVVLLQPHPPSNYTSNVSRNTATSGGMANSWSQRKFRPVSQPTPPSLSTNTTDSSDFGRDYMSSKNNNHEDGEEDLLIDDDVGTQENDVIGLSKSPSSSLHSIDSQRHQQESSVVNNSPPDPSKLKIIKRNSMLRASALQEQQQASATNSKSNSTSNSNRNSLHSSYNNPNSDSVIASAISAAIAATSTSPISSHNNAFSTSIPNGSISSPTKTVGFQIEENTGKDREETDYDESLFDEEWEGTNYATSNANSHTHAHSFKKSSQPSLVPSQQSSVPMTMNHDDILPLVLPTPNNIQSLVLRLLNERDDEDDVLDGGPGEEDDLYAFD